MAIAGFLGINVAIEHVQVYSVYRNDKINDHANPVRLREQMHRRQSQVPETLEDWNDETVGLEFGKAIKVVHKKIKLDAETGNGTYKVG